MVKVCLTVMGHGAGAKRNQTEPQAPAASKERLRGCFIVIMMERKSKEINTRADCADRLARTLNLS